MLSHFLRLHSESALEVRQGRASQPKPVSLGGVLVPPCASTTPTVTCVSPATHTHIHTHCNAGSWGKEGQILQDSGLGCRVISLPRRVSYRVVSPGKTCRAWLMGKGAVAPPPLSTHSLHMLCTRTCAWTQGFRGQGQSPNLCRSAPPRSKCGAARECAAKSLPRKQRGAGGEKRGHPVVYPTEAKGHEDPTPTRRPSPGPRPRPPDAILRPGHKGAGCTCRNN